MTETTPPAVTAAVNLATAAHDGLRYDTAATDLRELTAVIGDLEVALLLVTDPVQFDLLTGQIDDAVVAAQRSMAVLLSAPSTPVYRVYGWDDCGQSTSVDIVAENEVAAMFAASPYLVDVRDVYDI